MVPYGTFPPRCIGRATKGKRLYGQARRLTSPDLHILCRMCTVDNKAPQSNPFTQRIAKNKVPPRGKRWWRQPPKGVHFRRPQDGCIAFTATGSLPRFYTNWRHLFKAPATTLIAAGPSRNTGKHAPIPFTAAPAASPHSAGRFLHSASHR